MDATLIVALATPVVGGVIYVFYQHPDLYLKLYPWLCAIFFAADLSVIAWDLGSQAALHALMPLISVNERPNALSAWGSAQVSPVIIMVATALIGSYLVLTFWLSVYLEKKSVAAPKAAK